MKRKITKRILPFPHSSFLRLKYTQECLQADFFYIIIQLFAIISYLSFDEKNSLFTLLAFTVQIFWHVLFKKVYEAHPIYYFLIRFKGTKQQIFLFLFYTEGEVPWVTILTWKMLLCIWSFFNKQMFWVCFNLIWFWRKQNVNVAYNFRFFGQKLDLKY